MQARSAIDNALPGRQRGIGMVPARQRLGMRAVIRANNVVAVRHLSQCDAMLDLELRHLTLLQGQPGDRDSLPRL